MIFSTVADMITWALHCSWIHHLLHCLDEFLLMGSLDSNEGTRALSVVLEVLKYLGSLWQGAKQRAHQPMLPFLGYLLTPLHLS